MLLIPLVYPARLAGEKDEKDEKLADLSDEKDE